MISAKRAERRGDLYMSEIPTTPRIIPTGPATGILPSRSSKGTPITVIGTEAIRSGFDAKCLEQALNSRQSPGVTRTQSHLREMEQRLSLNRL